MADERIALRLRHLVGQGVNFCFYLLGKGQVRLPALSRPLLWTAPDADPFADFARRFGVADSLGAQSAAPIEALHVEPLWRPWLDAVAQACPDSAADALSVLPELPARPWVRNAFQRLGRVQLGEFLERWPGIKLDLEERLAQALRTFDLARILARHQQALAIEYRPGRVTFLYHLLPVFAISRAAGSCVAGAAYLQPHDRLAGLVAHETLHALIEQAQLWEREEIAGLLQGLGRVHSSPGARSPDRAGDSPLAEKSRPWDARDLVAEALCVLGDVLEHEGEGAPFERVERRVAAPALRTIARALYDTRRTRRSQGFVQWIAAALEEAARARPGARGA